MRRYLCLLAAVLLAAVTTAQPLFAASKRVTVAELEQQLDKLKGKPDAVAADRLSDMELSERATTARLARWEKTMPGDKSRDALTALVDASAFLKLPASDETSAPAPDKATQDEILTRVAANLKTVFSVLPNFYATRGTTHFEDALPQMQAQPMPLGGGRNRGGARIADSYSNFATIEPIHRTGKYDVIISYRDGDEVTEPLKGRTQEAVAGLYTSGEFGPVLQVVVGDARRGKIAWDHWEPGPTGTLAVFKYDVPAPESHFMLSLPNGSNIDEIRPGYRGEIAVDPESGNIFRLTEVARVEPPEDRVQAGIIVEYAPVALGERTYICPVRGVAFIKIPAAADRALQKTDAQGLQTYLNDEVFTDYHLFRGDTRIVPE